MASFKKAFSIFSSIALSLGAVSAEGVSSFSCPSDMVAVSVHYCIGTDRNRKFTWFHDQWWDLVESRGVFVKLKEESTQQDRFIPEAELDLAMDRDSDAALAFKIEHFFGQIWETNYLALYVLNQQSPQTVENVKKQIGEPYEFRNKYLLKLESAVSEASFDEPWILSKDDWLWLTNTGHRAFAYFAKHPERIVADQPE